jgi:NADH dehydrogenase FAD-containing subunit
LVKPSLQVDDASLPHIFAIGDVAEHGGPRMARAGFYQAHVVAANVLASIKGKAGNSLQPYKPNVSIENAIKLTLGKVSGGVIHDWNGLTDSSRLIMSCIRMMRKEMSCSAVCLVGARILMLDELGRHMG